MADNELGLGSISFPTNTDTDLTFALEELVRRARQNIDYLLRPQVVTITGDYTADDVDYTILSNTASGNITVTLPDAATVEQKILVIKHIAASGTTTVDGNGSQTIDGATTEGLTTQYQSIMIQSDGSNWQKLADA